MKYSDLQSRRRRQEDIIMYALFAALIILAVLIVWWMLTVPVGRYGLMGAFAAVGLVWAEIEKSK